MVQNVAYIVSRHQLYLETMLDYQEFAQLQEYLQKHDKNTKIISVFLCAHLKRLNWIALKQTFYKCLNSYNLK
jgi:hypothetical protein